MPEQNAHQCPWCRADLLHYTVGKWRCPHCTGFFGIKKNGEIHRDYAMPPPPWVATLLYVIIFFIVFATIVAIVVTSISK